MQKVLIILKYLNHGSVAAIQSKGNKPFTILEMSWKSKPYPSMTGHVLKIYLK